MGQGMVGGWGGSRVSFLVGCLRPSQIPVCKDLNTSAGTLTPFLVSAKVGETRPPNLPRSGPRPGPEGLSFPGVTGITEADGQKPHIPSLTRCSSWGRKGIQHDLGTEQPPKGSWENSNDHLEGAVTSTVFQKLLSKQGCPLFLRLSQDASGKEDNTHLVTLAAAEVYINMERQR